MKLRWDYCVHRTSLYKALGFKSDTILKDFHGVFKNFAVPVARHYNHETNTMDTKILMADVVVYKSTSAVGRRRVKHRIKIRCPECGSLIPSGRLHQHIFSKRCSVLKECETGPFPDSSVS